MIHYIYYHRLVAIMYKFAKIIKFQHFLQKAKVVFEDSKSTKALFTFITDCGMDALNGDYPQHIAEFVPANYGAAVLLVNYHCI